VSINTHSVTQKGEPKKKSLHFSNSFPSPIPYSHLLFLSLLKKHIEGGRKKKENILYTLYFSHYHPHRHLSSLSLLEKQTKILEKEAKEKRKEKT